MDDLLSPAVLQTPAIMNGDGAPLRGVRTLSTGGFEGLSLQCLVKLVQKGHAKGRRLLLSIKRDIERVDIGVLTRQLYHSRRHHREFAIGRHRLV